MNTMLDYEDLFLRLTDKLLQSKEYSDNWSISKNDPVFYDQFSHCKEGWHLVFRFYKDNRYTLSFGYIPNLNILTVEDRGKSFQLLPVNTLEINQNLEKLYNLFIVLNDTLLLEAINAL